MIAVERIVLILVSMAVASVLYHAFGRAALPGRLSSFYGPVASSPSGLENLWWP